jgi:antitoxin component HigA of HigAB toxin-antitoxin module
MAIGAAVAEVLHARQPTAPLRKAALIELNEPMRGGLLVVRAVLDAHGITQADLAAIWGVNQSRVSRILSGGEPLSIQKLEALPAKERAEIYEKLAEQAREELANQAPPSLPWSLEKVTKSSASIAVAFIRGDIPTMRVSAEETIRACKDLIRALAPRKAGR